MKSKYMIYYGSFLFLILGGINTSNAQNKGFETEAVFGGGEEEQAVIIAPPPPKIEFPRAGAVLRGSLLAV